MLLRGVGDGWPVIEGNLPARPPPLDSGVAAMLQFARQRPDSAEASDDRAMVYHLPGVRYRGTASQLECVRELLLNAHMTDEESVGERLRTLKERSGLSLKDIADALGAKQRSSIQRYFRDDFQPRNGLLGLEEAMRFAGVFVGKGDPPIQMDEILNLTALPQVPIRRADDVPPLSEDVAHVLADVLGSVAAGRALPAEERATLASIIQAISELFRTDLTIRQNPDRTRGALDILVLQHAGPPGARH